MINSAPSIEAAAHLAAIVEGSDDAIFSKTLDGHILSWNRAAERLFGYPAADMIGQSVRLLIPADRQAEEDEILAKVFRGELVTAFFTERTRRDGTSVRVSITVSPIRDAGGAIVAASASVRDAGPYLDAQTQALEAKNRFQMLADNMAQLAWIAAPDGAITWYNKRWYDYTGTNFEDMQGWGWQSVHHPDHVEQVVLRLKRSFESGAVWEDTFPLRGKDGTYRWFLSRAQPIRDDAGTVTSWFGTNTDVTELLDKEEQVRILLLEVNHRSKNMLAVVQALARRSAREHPDIVARFESRLSSLAANQNLLVNRGWSNIPVRELAEAQLSVLGSDAGNQINLSGHAFDLSPRTAEIIGMALHELATNALKFGALSQGCGRVVIEWQETADDAFEIVWRESGGPTVQAPDRSGFGTTLIRDIPARSLEADVSLDYDPQGLVWRLSCSAQAARELA
ncbi:sensor histidine kinase [Novosphingobium lentum]|uniref:sensor histidine kinase n=1 Tax=Novosphingobium lentum TaxID=145287 RepID=UPI000B1A9A2C|nr:PAS domain S-box protein [Novosphingobium lentum]